MSKPPILRNFVSEIDLFLNEYDQQHPRLSKAQQKEQAEYRRIYRLRDTSDRADENTKLWEGF